MARLFLIFLVVLCSVATGCAKPMTFSARMAELSGLVPDPKPTAKPVVELHGDTDFGQRERELIELAMKEWRLQTGNLAVASVVWDLDFQSAAGLQEHVDRQHHLLFRSMSWMKDVQEQDGPRAMVLAFVYPSGGIHNPWGDPVRMKLVADRLDDESRFFQVTVHELGHVFGVPHVNSVQSVMYPSYFVGKTSCLKRGDLAAFCDVNDCGSVTMYPCE